MPQVSPEDIVAAPAAETPAPAPETAPAAPEEPKAKAEAGDELPDELLKEAPALQLLLQGSPPATFAPKDAEYPELKTVAKHLKELGKAGFGVYPTKDGANIVFFNGLYVTPDDVAAADKGGTLDQIAVPYDELRSALGSQEAPSGTPGAESAPVSAPAAPGAQPAASTENKLTTARVKNLSVGAPTSGPVPGQGRILNNILKPVV
jgi:hypothetical protein